MSRFCKFQKQNRELSYARHEGVSRPGAVFVITVSEGAELAEACDRACPVRVQRVTGVQGDS